MKPGQLPPWEDDPDHGHVPTRWAKDITEAAWTSQIMQQAHHYGWVTAHFRNSIQGQGDRTRHLTAVSGDGKGWPDAFMVNTTARYVAMAIELKTWSNRAGYTPEQEQWVRNLRRAGIPSAVLNPADTPMLDALIQGTHRPPAWMLNPSAELLTPPTLTVTNPWKRDRER